MTREGEEILTWYAVYTKSRAEKKVLNELTAKGIETFVPLQKQLKDWSDRKKIVLEPLIRGYAFVNVSKKNYNSVLLSPFVVRYVTYLGKAAIIPNNQIEILKKIVEQEYPVEVSTDALSKGDQIEVIMGHLTGTKGELVEIRGKKKVLVKIDYISSNILISLPADFIKITNN